MSKEITVRRFDASDREPVLALAGRLTTGVAPWRDAAKVAAAVRAWVEASVREVGEDGHAVFVALVADKVVGVVTVQEQAHWTGEVDAYVGELITAEDSEGLGVARALLANVEAWAVGRGLANVSLETGVRNVRARRFYGLAGFEEEELRLTKRLASGAQSTVQGWRRGRAG